MKPKKQCRRVSSVLVSDDYIEGKTSVLRIACKQWTCPICGPKLQNKWKHHLLKTLSDDKHKDKQWCFLTITLMPEFHDEKTPSEGVDRLQSVWKKLYMKLRRKVGGRLISYVYFYEGHKNHTYHVHAILDIGVEYDKNPYITVWKKPSDHHPLQRWLKDLLPTIGAGWEVDLRRIRGYGTQSSAIGAVLYAASYMGKNNSWEGFKRSARRVGTSQDIGGINSKRKKGRSAWEVKHGISRDEYFRKGSKIHLVIEDKSLELSDFEGDWYYPPIDTKSHLTKVE